MNLSKKEAEQILSMLKQAQPAGMTNDDMADRAMIEYNQGLQPATGAKPLPTAGALSGPSATVNNQILASPDWAAAEQATGKLNNIKGELLSRINAGKAQPAAVTAPTPAAKPLVQGLHNAAAPAASTSKPVSPTVKTQAAVPLGMTNDDMADKMMIEDNANVPAPLGAKQGNLAPGAPKLAPAPAANPGIKAPAPLQVGTPGNGITIGKPLAGGVSLAPTRQAPVTLPSPGGDINIGNPTGAPEPVLPTPPAPTPAAAAPSGDPTDQEVQLFQKLHNGKFNSASRRDQEMLRHLRSAGQEAGGYGDFKTLRNLAYAQQYGAKSDYGRLAQKWRDSAGSGSIPKIAQYTTLTRRNSGVTTLDGNIWVNPADQEWLHKSAAYADLSWEDYKNLDPDETPENIEVFFTK